MISKAELEAMGCFSWYPLNNNTNDYIGNFDLTPVSGLEYNRTSDGKSVMIPKPSCAVNNSISNCPLYQKTEFCVNNWVYFGEVPDNSTNDSVLIDYFGSGKHIVFIGYYDDSSYLYFFINSIVISSLIPFTNVFELNKWYMTTFNFKLDTTIKCNVYINAKYVETLDSTQTSINYDPIALSIGTLYNYQSFYLHDSKLKDVMLFNQSLTPEQIDYIYRKTFIR